MCPARQGIAKQCPERDDRRVLSGIIFINRNGLRWCDAPADYSPPKTLYNRWKRWSDMGVFARIMMGLAEAAPDNKTISMDATYLKAHRTASSLGLKRGRLITAQQSLQAAMRGRTDQGRHEYEVTCRHPLPWFARKPQPSALPGSGYQWTPDPFFHNRWSPSQRCKHRLPGSG